MKDNLAYKIKSFFSPGGILSQKLPGYEPRQAQLEMATSVLEAIEQDGNLIVEAATGTGKTLAYLVPALAAGQRIVVSTGTKNLQEQLYFKDIPFLQSVGGSFTSAVMKGRGNYLCLRKLKLMRSQPLLKGMEDVNHFAEIERWRRSTKTGDFGELTTIPEGLPLLRQLSCSTDNCTGRICPHYENCFLVKMRAFASGADIVIVNHHLLFADLSVREGGFGAVIPDYNRVILDEAHEIESVATSYFGVEICNYRFEELVRDTLAEMVNEGIDDDELPKLATQIGNKSVELFKAIRPASDRFIVREAIDESIIPFFQRLFDALSIYESHIGAMSTQPETMQILYRRAKELRQYLQMIFDMEDRGFVYWGERRGRGIFLKASPINVSPYIKENLFDAVDSAIMTSATLTVQNNFEYFRTRTGVEEAEELKLESHFNYRKQTRLFIPTDLPNPNSQNFINEATERMTELLHLTKGRAFLLFTSFKNMERAYDLLKNAIDYPLLLQGTSSRQDLLTRFRENEKSVLLATASFWQGVDVRGPGLSLVVIDKLPFAVPDDPLISARIERIREDGGNPFMSLQIPAAALTLKQGLGRLIRSSEDRGIMAVLDSRLLTKFYGNIFLKSLHGSPVVTKMEQVATWWQKATE